MVMMRFRLTEGMEQKEWPHRDRTNVNVHVHTCVYNVHCKGSNKLNMEHSNINYILQD